MTNRRTRHAVYNINYHLVWCPKYRRPVLEGAVGERLAELISAEVERLDGTVHERVVMPDHVHVLASFPPTIAINQIVHQLKGASSHPLRQAFPFLNSRLPSLWTHSQYVGTAGVVSAQTILKDIEAQRRSQRMNRTFEYRLYPGRAERRTLELLLEQAREVYHAALAPCKITDEGASQHPTAMSQWSYCREWRKQPGLLLNASSLQQIWRRLDKRDSAFFRRTKAGETPGHPRFKGESRFNSLADTYSDGVKLAYDETQERMVRQVQNVGNIKIKFHRSLPDGSPINQVVIKRKASGWYVTLMLDGPDPLP